MASSHVGSSSKALFRAASAAEREGLRQAVAGETCLTLACPKKHHRAGVGTEAEGAKAAFRGASAAQRWLAVSARSACLRSRWLPEALALGRRRWPPSTSGGRQPNSVGHRASTQHPVSQGRGAASVPRCRGCGGGTGAPTRGTVSGHKAARQQPIRSVPAMGVPVFPLRPATFPTRFRVPRSPANIVNNVLRIYG